MLEGGDELGRIVHLWLVVEGLLLLMGIVGLLLLGLLLLLLLHG